MLTCLLAGETCSTTPLKVMVAAQWWELLLEVCICSAFHVFGKMLEIRHISLSNSPFLSCATDDAQAKLKTQAMSRLSGSFWQRGASKHGSGWFFVPFSSLAIFNLHSHQMQYTSAVINSKVYKVQIPSA